MEHADANPSQSDLSAMGRELAEADAENTLTESLLADERGLRFAAESDLAEAWAEIERLKEAHETTAAELHVWMKLKAEAERQRDVALEALREIAAPIEGVPIGEAPLGARRTRRDRQ